MHPEQSLPWRRRVEEDVHVLGVVDDDVAFLLAAIDPAHHNDPVVLVNCARPRDKDGFRGEKAVGELLLDRFTCVHVHLHVGKDESFISFSFRFFSIFSITLTTAPSSLKTLWEK